ncbi:hypothetical protein OHB31_18740 [Streptomyces microflavus]|uniref:hypothetical protein n=1 Tax=Streptomyces griseus group TaxID=629295 RepID=UPI002DDA1379|nr:hypothetical protein [Streptomyces microflavus]WSA62072.1 hypothetical protein OHB31_18740 [Streptomyces microflavus]
MVTAAQKVETRAEREIRLDQEAEVVFQLKFQGYTDAQIRRQTGYTRDSIKRRLERARRNLGESTSNDVRTDLERSLDDVIKRTYSLLDEAETVSEKAQLLRVITDTAAKKARLLGVEAPSKLVHSMEQDWGNVSD